MNQIVSNAIVLRRVNYQEADRILTVLTDDNGKIALLARGVRKPKSKLAGGIELFGTNQITYVRGKGEISNLISARLKKHYGNIVNDLDRTQACYEFIKLITKSIESNAGEEFYPLLNSAFEFLDDLVLNLDIIRIWFGLQFLQLMGHSPSAEVGHEVVGGKQVDKFRFDLDKMSFFAFDDGAYSVNHLKLFRISLSNEPPQIKRITKIDTLLPLTLNLVQILMVSSGFNKI